jgi:hypothetical protein
VVFCECYESIIFEYLIFSVMLFFNLDASQKLIFSLLAGVVLFSSCSGPKKVAVSGTPKQRQKRLQKMRVPGRTSRPTLHQSRSKKLTRTSEEKEVVRQSGESHLDGAHDYWDTLTNMEVRRGLGWIVPDC